MSACADPNNPSYDPATRLDDTARKVIWLCEHAWDRMNQWERDFCQSVYGASPLSRKQHVRVWAMHKQYSSNSMLDMTSAKAQSLPQPHSTEAR